MSGRFPRLLVVALIGLAWTAFAADTLAVGRVGLKRSGEVVTDVQDFASHFRFKRVVLDGVVHRHSALQVRRVPPDRPEIERAASSEIPRQQIGQRAQA